MNKSKIPHGITTFGAVTTLGTLGYSMYQTQQSNIQNAHLQQQVQNLRRQNQELMQQNAEIVQKTSEVIQHSKEVLQQNKTVLQNVSQIQDKINNLINKGSNFNIPSIDDFYTILNSFLNSLTSFDIPHQIVIGNLVVILYLLSLFISYLSGLYGNYLIDKFDLSNRFPRLAKLLQYRMKYQQYYFKYLGALTFFGFLLGLTFNIFVLYILNM
jgi:DNA repair ATPase RecN